MCSLRELHLKWQELLRRVTGFPLERLDYHLKNAIPYVIGRRRIAEGDLLFDAEAALEVLCVAHQLAWAEWWMVDDWRGEEATSCVTVAVEPLSFEDQRLLLAIELAHFMDQIVPPDQVGNWIKRQLGISHGGFRVSVKKIRRIFRNKM